VESGLISMSGLSGINRGVLEVAGIFGEFKGISGGSEVSQQFFVP
jgi:hypothetical protein